MAESTRRWLGGKARPAFLTCLTMVVTIVVLLQYTYTNSGPAYSLLHSSLVTRPSSVLSKLDVLTPTKERPHTMLTQASAELTENITTVPKAAELRSLHRIQNFTSVVVSEEIVPGAAEPSHFMLVEPETPKAVEEFSTPVEQVAQEPPYIGSEAESLEVAKDVADSTTSSADVGLEHNLSELNVSRTMLGSDPPALVVGDDRVLAMERPAWIESSAEANVQLMVVETEIPHGASEGRHDLGNFPSASLTLSSIEGADKIPDQVQRQETDSQEIKEQPVIESQPPVASLAPKKSKASPIFDELQACKKAINDATRESADPSLYRILYKNVAAFSKSYELMEKVFKVYVYRDGRKPLVHSGPLIGIYASEGQFIMRMQRASEYLTSDPSKAHMFFLPYSVQHMVTNLYVPNSHTMLPLATFIKEYVDSLARRYPYWNRSQGGDHFFVSCHDWGPATARDHPTLRSNAMKVVCNADLTEEFVLGKDASLPEVYIHKLKKKVPIKLGGPGYDKRPYLAFFAGQMHGRVRPILLEHWKDKDPDMKIYEVLPKPIAKKIPYIQHMKLSKFCICAMGYEVNSPRIVEAIYYDCVPVIIADNFVLPFSDVLNWNAFSITIAESDIPNLKTILSAIPEKSYRSMQVRLRKVRRHFVWHEKPEKYDVFHMILHSVWMSRLIRLNQVGQSAGELF